jgi:hypothetical protein
MGTLWLNLATENTEWHENWLSVYFRAFRGKKTRTQSRKHTESQFPCHSVFSVAKFNHKGHKGKTKVYGKKQGTHLPDEPKLSVSTNGTRKNLVNQKKYD